MDRQCRFLSGCVIRYICESIFTTFEIGVIRWDQHGRLPLLCFQTFSISIFCRHSNGRWKLRWYDLLVLVLCADGNRTVLAFSFHLHRRTRRVSQLRIFRWCKS